MWGRLYKTQNAKNIFEEVNKNLTIGEDYDFFYRYFLQCKSVLITDICGYHYRIRKNSVVHAVNANCDYLKNTCELYETLLPVFSNHPYSTILLPQLQIKLAAMIAKAPSKMGFSNNVELKLCIK